MRLFEKRDYPSVGERRVKKRHYGENEGTFKGKPPNDDTGLRIRHYGIEESSSKCFEVCDVRELEWSIQFRR